MANDDAYDVYVMSYVCMRGTDMESKQRWCNGD